MALKRKSLTIEDDILNIFMEIINARELDWSKGVRLAIKTFIVYDGIERKRKEIKDQVNEKEQLNTIEETVIKQQKVKYGRKPNYNRPRN